MYSFGIPDRRPEIWRRPGMYGQGLYEDIPVDEGEQPRKDADG